MYRVRVEFHKLDGDAEDVSLGVVQVAIWPAVPFAKVSVDVTGRRPVCPPRPPAAGPPTPRDYTAPAAHPSLNSTRSPGSPAAARTASAAASGW